ncbi:non-ribosomal peptide synthetase/polyketide synthetase [Legionella santicrucis]|uniref:Non-ribosomal peptide synthetase/polyketide synthetase n=1 Tax=Legionella santicrucis TaxID=45074 RepID=A0A0W0YLJ3_9GAMM|nr:beta-ketoacyl synthase N-terminal-like domain-containing protein [Legionella santicrucis]KTD57454.1 non-ribosomal peptide synthetase/polyketide synthetase [Legionella santicrucis]
MYKSNEPIAIVGYHCRLPQCNDANQLMQLLDNKKVAIQQQTQELNSDLTAYKAEIDHPDCFDAEFFGFSIKEAELLCPQQRLLLEDCWLALDNAGYAPPHANHENTAVFASCTGNPFYWQALLQDYPDPFYQFQILVHNDKDFIATRVAYLLNLKGPAMTIQTGCSSSLVALHQAKRALEANDCNMAIVAASSVTYPIINPMPAIQGMIFSPTGRCRPYAPGADGTVMGMGTVALVLKTLSQAQKDGDSILALIKGSAINNDGKGKMSFTGPSLDGQIDVIHKALKDANLTAKDIHLVEGHGTGTIIGDELELAVFHETYGQNRETPCWLGSVKANLGHLDVVSGLVSVLKTSLALNRAAAFPQPYQDSVLQRSMPNTKLELCAEKMPIDPHTNAAVHSLGVGGTNAHVILSAPPPGVKNGDLLLQRKPRQVFKQTPIPLPSALRSNTMKTNDSVCTTSRNTPLSELVKQAWIEILGNKDLHADDNFFACGGDSLMAIALIDRINKLIGLKLSYLFVYENPTFQLFVQQVVQHSMMQMGVSEYEPSENA